MNNYGILSLKRIKKKEKQNKYSYVYTCKIDI